MATAEPGSRSGRAVGWPLEVEEEGGGGGEGRGLVELEEARAPIRRRRAAQAPGPSQAASLPAAGGWMGRLQAAAAAAEAAAAAAAVSAASTDHLTHPPIGNRGPRSARSLLSPLPLPPPWQSAARKTLNFRGGAARVYREGWRLGGAAIWRACVVSAPPLPGLSAFAVEAAAPIFRCFRGAPGLRCGVSLRGGRASSRPFRSALAPRQGCGFLATPPWLHL